MIDTDRSVHDVLEQLSGVVNKGDHWVALCPCHDDHNPSLKISVSESGKTLVMCWAGCPQDALVDRVLRNTSATATSGFTPASPKSNKPSKAYGAWSDAADVMNGVLGTTYSEAYAYHDASGEHVGTVLRFDQENGDKTFRPIRKDADGWRIGGLKEPSPLFGLNDLRGDVIYVCEGEKATEAAISIGLVATTSAGGSKAWQKTDWTAIAGKDVRILRDNDAPGIEFAAGVAERLKSLDPKTNVRISELPGVPEHGDIVEWLEAQGDAVEPDELVKRIEALFTESLNDRPFGYLTSKELADGDFKLEYLIDDVLVRGQPCIGAGPHKSLKTGMGVDLTISLAMGGWFLQKFKVNRPVRAALISGESGRATIQETAKRIAAAKGVDYLGDVANATWCFDLPQLGHGGSEAALERFITDLQIEAFIIDPAYLAMPVGDDASNLFKMGVILKGLSQIAQRTNCTPIILHHFRKGVPVGETPELHWMAWAGLQEWARQWLLINRRSVYDPDKGGSHRLWLCSGGSAGHSGMWGIDIDEGTQKTPGGRFWDVTVMLPSEAKASCANADEQGREDRDESRRQRKLNRDLEAIVKVLQKRPDGDTASIIGASAGLNSSRYQPAIAMGLENGKLADCRVTKGNRSYDGIRLSPTTPTTPTNGPTVGVARSQTDKLSL